MKRSRTPDPGAAQVCFLSPSKRLASADINRPGALSPTPRLAALQLQPPSAEACCMVLEAPAPQPPAAAALTLPAPRQLPCGAGQQPMQRWAISLRSFPAPPPARDGSLLGVAVADLATGFVLALSLHRLGDVLAAVGGGGGGSSEAPNALVHWAFAEARGAAEALGVRAGVPAAAASAWPCEGACLGDTAVLEGLWRSVGEALPQHCGAAGGGAAPLARSASAAAAQRMAGSDARWACGEGWVDAPQALAHPPPARPPPGEAEEDAMGQPPLPSAAAAAAATPVCLIPTSTLLALPPAVRHRLRALAPLPATARPLARLLDSCNVRASIPGMAARTGSGSPQIALMGWMQGQGRSGTAAAAAGAQVGGNGRSQGGALAMV